MQTHPPFWPSWHPPGCHSWSSRLCNHSTQHTAGKRAWIAGAVLCQDRVRVKNEKPKKNKVGRGGHFVSYTVTLSFQIPESENTATSLALVQPKKEQCIKPACFWVWFCRFYICTCTHVHVHHLKTVDIVIDVQSHKGIYLIPHCVELDC